MAPIDRSAAPRIPFFWRLILAGVTLAVLALAFVWSGTERAAADATAAPQLAEHSPRPRGAIGSFTGERATAPCAFAEGARMAYAVTTRTSVDLDMQGVAQQVQVDPRQASVASSAPSKRDLERSWLLELEVLTRDERGSILAARISDRGMRNLYSSQGAAPSSSAALSDTFLIRVGRRCSLREFGWRSEGDLDAAREQQLMAAGLGFWAPQDTREAAAYGAASFDMSGRYQASYVYEEDGSIRGELLAFSAPQTQVTVPSSVIEAQLAPGQWFASLTNERDLELAFHGVPFGTHFRSTRALATELGEFRPQVALDDGGWSWGRLGAAEGTELTRLDPALAELSYEDAMARYRELLASGNISQYGGLLRDWLRANPDQAGRLLDELREGSFEADQKGRGGLFFALGSAGTPEAGAVLVELLSSDSDRVMHQVLAAQSIAMIAEPSEPMLDALREASAREDLHEVERGSMALALGTFARESMDSQPELAAAAREEISSWLASPDDPEDLGALSHSLLAAGNAGHDELAPSVTSYLDHEDPGVRRSATHAMRNMSPEAAFPALERGLGDADRVVRTSAMHSALAVTRSHDRPPSEALRELAASSLASEHMAERAAAIRLLDEAAKRGDSQARAALQRELNEQVERGDTRQLALIGAGMSGQWKAQ